MSRTKVKVKIGTRIIESFRLTNGLKHGRSNVAEFLLTVVTIQSIFCLGIDNNCPRSLIEEYRK